MGSPVALDTPEIRTQPVTPEGPVTPGEPATDAPPVTLDAAEPSGSVTPSAPVTRAASETGTPPVTPAEPVTPDSVTRRPATQPSRQLPADEIVALLMQWEYERGRFPKFGFVDPLITAWAARGITEDQLRVAHATAVAARTAARDRRPVSAAFLETFVTQALNGQSDHTEPGQSYQLLSLALSADRIVEWIDHSETRRVRRSSFAVTGMAEAVEWARRGLTLDELQRAYQKAVEDRASGYAYDPTPINAASIRRFVARELFAREHPELAGGTPSSPLDGGASK